MNFYCLVTIGYVDSRTGTQRAETVIGSEGPLKTMQEFMDQQNEKEYVTRDLKPPLRGEHLLLYQPLTEEQYGIMAAQLRAQDKQPF